ncbi:hypothetical protein RclHR1_02220009 [Rhizophagus clarus]|uniref:BTB domain-containing protein n=1 Tax=Rhizophagus clarus TaxID=94130 RepID=A0A2Z6R7K5_9GLOM|nr:hypothetical protein RclHR1_02220009 [Rhizophagus clarus]GES81798.1 hypothetical protein GLOIN_2v1487826 [Rhizophagus clarus]
MGRNFEYGVLNSITLMLNDADDYNVIIQVGKDQNTKEFHAHSNILRARSQYFNKAFLNNLFTKKNEMIIFNMENITSKVFELILKYIYTAKLSLTYQDDKDIFDLLLASDELLFEELIDYIQDYLTNQSTSIWIRQNLLFVLRSVFKREKYKKLQDFCFSFVIPQFFITTDKYSSSDKDILYYFLERRKFRVLHAEEVVVWDLLIKWGINQIPELVIKNNQNEWTNKNYEDLKNTLSDFIPLIMMLEINSEDFYYKVRPYKPIIPSNIYEEAMAHYLVEQHKFVLRSHHKDTPVRPHIIMTKMVKLGLVDEIIDKIIDSIDEEFVPKHKFKRFKLIYRGSRDGIDDNSFKDRCLYGAESLVLIKVQESSKIFVGYSFRGFDLYRDDLINDYDRRDSDKILLLNDKYDNIHDRVNYFYDTSLCIINRKLHVKTVKKTYYECEYYNREDWVTANIYTIEEIEVFINLRHEHDEWVDDIDYNYSAHFNF